MNCGYKLIISDMDGTLLNKKGEITKENLNTIESLTKKGNILFSIVTGRQSKTVRRLLKEYGLNLNIIGLNGAEIRNSKNEVNFEAFIDADTSKRIIDFLEEKQFLYKCYNADEIIMNSPNRLKKILQEFVIKKYGKISEEGDLLRYLKKISQDSKIIKDIKKYFEENKFKVSKIEILDSNINDLKKLKQSLICSSVNVTSSYKYNIEIVNSTVNKGEAVRILSDKMGINREDIAAFGDNYNDIPMLRYAGVSIAMANSVEEVKKIADFITLSNEEDGVAYGIRKYILTK